MKRLGNMKMSPHMVQDAYQFSRHRQHVEGSMPREYPPCDGKCVRYRVWSAWTYQLTWRVVCCHCANLRQCAGLRWHVSVSCDWTNTVGTNMNVMWKTYINTLSAFSYRWLLLSPKEFKTFMQCWMCAASTWMIRTISLPARTSKALRTSVSLSQIRMLTRWHAVWHCIPRIKDAFTTEQW